MKLLVSSCYIIFDFLFDVLSHICFLNFVNWVDCKSLDPPVYLRKRSLIVMVCLQDELIQCETVAELEVTNSTEYVKSSSSLWAKRTQSIMSGSLGWTKMLPCEGIKSLPGIYCSIRSQRFLSMQQSAISNSWLLPKSPMVAAVLCHKLQSTSGLLTMTVSQGVVINNPLKCLNICPVEDSSH